MKKILILGGANLHCKLVRIAKNMGYYTIVTDYLENSPAKKIADKSYMYDINDIEGIVEMCKAEGVSAVLNTHIDPGQVPYQKICEKLGLPCYCTKEQVEILTDKNKFKECCEKYGVDVIESFEVENVLESEDYIKDKYPLLVKPAHSRGSRGQSICYTYDEVVSAIKTAEKESDNGEALIESYMKGKPDFSMTIFFIKGKSYLIRTVDRHLGPEELGLEKVAIASVSPSNYTDLYVEKVHNKIVNMLQQIGIKNGPVFMQGFVDGDKIRFYDPGFRFPGTEYDTMQAKILNKNLLENLIDFAFKGTFEGKYAEYVEDGYRLDGHWVTALFPLVRKGKICKIEGLDEIERMKGVHSYTLRHQVGEEIEYTHNVNQRMAEIDLIAGSKEELRNTISQVKKYLKVFDEQNENMIYSEFDENDV